MDIDALLNMVGESSPPRRGATSGSRYALACALVWRTVSWEALTLVAWHRSRGTGGAGGGAGASYTMPVTQNSGLAAASGTKK